jgi:dTDP-4-amino-4,6-dideoxygalactose transaminase
MNSKIPATIGFNRPHLTGKELHYIADAHGRGQLAGDGVYTQRCSERLEEITGSPKALLTHSCTAALEMSAILVDINPGDEIIMPSYTFVSTANAFVLRGGVPVFVDIRADTLNIDEMQIESAITPRTRAIVVVHYAGVACEMDVILDIAARHKLWVIEDAAQAVLARYKGRALGSIGHLGAFSFHETKNVISGEGGALLINDRRLISRAEVIREKGTNRSQFFLGQVDKYTWVDVGSSFLPGEINAAFLWAQLEEAEQITRKRINLWDQYHLAFQPLEDEGLLRRPTIPITCQHNAHMYYLILQDRSTRDKFISRMHHESINCVFHYVPLHSSPASQRYSRTSGHLPITTRLADCLVRLPLWIGLDEHQVRVINAVRKILS